MEDEASLLNKLKLNGPQPLKDYSKDPDFVQDVDEDYDAKYFVELPADNPYAKVQNTYLQLMEGPGPADAISTRMEFFLTTTISV